MSAFWERFRKNPRNWIILAVALVIISMITWASYMRFVEGKLWAEWTGFSEYTGDLPADDRGKTLWDWMELLIIPVILGFGAILFNKSQKDNEQRLAIDQQMESALQSYLDNMAELLLKGKLLEKKDIEEDPTVDVAQVRTITTLRILDTKRKNVVFQFLRDANLAKFLLVGASLQEADIHNTSIFGIVLKEANLFFANLSEANLWRADLSGANLTGANLGRAYLGEVNLRRAKLRDAYLWGTILTEADLGGADLSGADLSEANLRQASLKGTYLKGTRLRGAYLWDVDLNDANLWEADLRDSEVTDRQLVQVNSLRHAVMPDNTRYDGRYNLSGDIENAKTDHIDINDSSMASYYFVPLEEYRLGQEWARENLPNLRGESD